jgi:NAD+ diphosphatase
MLQTPSTFSPLMAAPADAVAHTFLFHGDRLLLREPIGPDGSPALPDADTLAAVAFDATRAQPVGLWRERYYQAAWTDEEAEAPPGYAWRGLRSLFGVASDEWLGLAGRASQIAGWTRNHRFCGACATPTERVPGERSFRCPHCGLLAYPRISPAMMVLIRKGDSVLLALHANSPTQRFTPLAGFLEAGESVEEAVHREVMEEVGLRVTNLRYFMSQSWPFPHSLMIAYTADYLDGEIRVDPSEIAEARWFGPGDAWPERVTPISISGMLVDAHRPPSQGPA